MEVAVLFVVWAIMPVSSSAETAGAHKGAFINKYDVFGAKERSIDIPEDTFPKKTEIEQWERALPGCEHGWFESVHEGSQLHYRSFLPVGRKTKGIVVFYHGISGQSGRALVMDNGRKLGQALLSDALTKEGYALYAFDYLGHGFSEGIRWFVPDYKTNRDDCIAFSKLVASKHEEGTPIFLMGESYGGNLALHTRQYFEDHPAEKPAGLDSTLLIAPAIIGDLPPYPVYCLLRYVLAPLFPEWIPFFMPNPVSQDRIWRDASVLAKLTKFSDCRLEGGGKPFRLGTAVSLVVALDEVRSEIIPKFATSFCVVHGESDFAVPITGTEFLLEKCKTPESDREVHRIPEAAHDLLADPAAEEVVQYFMEFLKTRMEKKKESDT